MSEAVPLSGEQFNEMLTAAFREGGDVGSYAMLSGIKELLDLGATTAQIRDEVEDMLNNAFPDLDQEYKDRLGAQTKPKEV